MRERSERSGEMDQRAYQRARQVFQPPPKASHEQAVQALALEVIARLERHSSTPSDGAQPSTADIEALCDALLSPDDALATEMVMRAQADGMSVDVLTLAYLGDAARNLGVRWDEDRVSATEVIIAAGRIYALLRGLRRLFIPWDVIRPDAYRAAFAATPGETHTLGVTMAADYLRRRGWNIDLKVGLTHDEVIDEVGLASYPIIGLSASCSSRVFALSRLIVALRVRNPGAWIIVSGPITTLEPDLLRLVDADAVAADLASAEAQMEAHVTRRQADQQP
ncbi:cobalamin-dependent protein [Paracoccaceae bacterium Fryx2]|nr:cobalamin-dependent protein [Paracoccaceae bacterium Fryx2]